MKKRENFCKEDYVATMVATMAFSIAEGAKIVTGPARADQEDAGSFAQIMNCCGYDYVTLGNHDFNYGMAYLDSYLDALEARLK